MMDQENLYQFDEQFRDTIGTVDAEGKRVWVYPKKPGGNYHNARVVVSVFLLAILFAGPFIKIGGQPFLLLNVFERKFVVFGQVFWPQDFFLLAVLLITFFVFVILFTVVFGRLWCGWACPQTLFMEMVFRKIEYWIEGDANQQRKLDKSPWTFAKIRKKGLKHLIFALIAIIIAHTVMAYLIGVEEVKDIVSQPPSEHPSGFIGLIGFAAVFYSVFAFFREQACVAVCPYGRLQGVLLDKKSIAVMYDWLRGEPRGRLKKGNVQAEKGDCIDCKLCVHACPTGIDIRNGTQLECVNCTACIDACDEVMTKISKPKGLIHYASHESIEKGRQKLLSPRVVAYSFVLTVLLGILGFSLATRSDTETTILKVPGQLYQKTEDGNISNLYNVQVVNKTFESKTLSFKVENITSAIIKKVGNGAMEVPSGDLAEGVYFVTIPPADLHGVKTELVFGIYENGELIEKTTSKFLSPPSIKK